MASLSHDPQRKVFTDKSDVRVWYHAVLFHTGEDGENCRGDNENEVFNSPVSDDFFNGRLEAGHIL